MSTGAVVAKRPGSYLEQFMPTEPPVHCIIEVPFDRWAAEGVNTLVLDAEAHLGVTGAKDLDPQKIAAVARARDAGIQNVALATNLRIKSEADRNLLRVWGEQVGADLCLYPQQPEQRKPSPFMFFQAMQYFDATPQQTGSSGDKASADVRGAFLAHIEHRAWTRPYGANRHPGDKFVRGSLESILRAHAHLELTPKLNKKSAIDPVALAELMGVESELIDMFTNKHIDGLDNIVGLGLPNISLDPATLESLKQPFFRKALESLVDTYEYYGEVPGEKLKSFLFEYGRLTADGLVLLRLLSAFGIAAVNLSDLPQDTKNITTLALAAPIHPADIGDGIAARRHKKGATKRGGAYDQNVDKIVATVIDLFPLMMRELITKEDAWITIGREIGLTALRRPFKQRGIGTSSVMSGKIAQWAKGGAQMFALSYGDRCPDVNQVLQRAATIAKVASAIHAPLAWITAHEQAQHDVMDDELKRILGETILSGALPA